MLIRETRNGEPTYGLLRNVNKQGSTDESTLK
jgi:hypothetical protein